MHKRSIGVSRGILRPSCGRCLYSQRQGSPGAQTPQPDPLTLIGPQLNELRLSLSSMLGAGHPALSEIVNYYSLQPSKQVRPLLVVLFSQATNGLGANWSQKLWEAECEGAGGRAEDVDRPLMHPDVLNDFNAGVPAEFYEALTLRPPRPRRRLAPTPLAPRQAPSLKLSGTTLPTQLRLAQIVEMLHTASLLHDDVIDESALRRGAPSAPSTFGNKLSVLGGTFILGHALAGLSRLGDAEVTELVASAISNLVDGEIVQMKRIKLDDVVGRTSRDAWNIYLQKTYLKTASLMAKGARSAVVLGGCKEGEVWKDIAYAYGRNLGIAFQLVDDVLDYESASATLGKPGGADLQLGLATGPALYAWEEHPEMGELIHRKFDRSGDVEMARDYVLRSSGVQRTKVLAKAFAAKSKEVLQQLPDSGAKEALMALAEKVIGRTS